MSLLGDTRSSSEPRRMALGPRRSTAPSSVGKGGASSFLSLTVPLSFTSQMQKKVRPGKGCTPRTLHGRYLTVLLGGVSGTPPHLPPRGHCQHFFVRMLVGGALQPSPGVLLSDRLSFCFSVCMCVRWGDTGGEPSTPNLRAQATLVGTDSALAPPSAPELWFLISCSLPSARGLMTPAPPVPAHPGGVISTVHHATSWGPRFQTPCASRGH